MDKKNLDQIGQIVEKAVKVGFADVWEGNLEPAFNTVFDKIDTLEGKVNQLPTKTYLDDKIANLQGDLITKLHKEDEKINRLADILREKNLISDNDLKELANLIVFPK